MSKFITKLRQKSEAQRKRFAFACSIVITAAALIVFILVFFNEFHEYADGRAGDPKQEGSFSNISKSYNSYKKTFDDSPLAQQMEDAKFYLDDTATTSATSSASAGTSAATSAPASPLGPVVR